MSDNPTLLTREQAVEMLRCPTVEKLGTFRDRPDQWVGMRHYPYPCLTRICNPNEATTMPN